MHVTSCRNDTNSFFPTDIGTPINIDNLKLRLSAHPDKEKVRFVIQGFRQGFDIGHRGHIATSRPPNLKSARDQPIAVQAAINTEIARGHTSGPFAAAPFRTTHCSPIGAVSKPDGSARLILDLSSPRGDAVNEGIDSEQYSVRYSKFDDAIELVRQLGAGAFMAKIDIKHAFRLCPVQQKQWPLLCFFWNNKYYFDVRLPFGSRSSPFIFNAFAELLCWVLVMAGIQYIIHYLDDFFMARAAKDKCASDMAIMVSVCDELGVPIASDKTVGPTNTITYLGIEIESNKMSIRLPEDKLIKIKNMVNKWVIKKTCTKRELLSLIGSLSFACKVVKPGRMFLRRLIDLSTTASKLNHHVTMDAGAKADITWWKTFLPAWHGTEIIQGSPVTSYSLQLHTDASDVGFGAVFGNKWLYGPWRGDIGSKNINVRECFAIWAAIQTWGHNWVNKQILFFTDSMVVTLVWKTGTCRDKDLMGVVRAIFMFIATHNINIYMQHIPGVHNYSADKLSRLQVEQFKIRNPSAEVHPSAMPEAAWLI